MGKNISRKDFLKSAAMSAAGIGLFGTLVCLIFARFWGKKRVALDEGRI